LAETYPRKFETKRVHGPIHISFYMFVLYLVKTSDARLKLQNVLFIAQLTAFLVK